MLIEAQKGRGGEREALCRATSSSSYPSRLSYKFLLGCVYKRRR